MVSDNIETYAIDIQGLVTGFGSKLIHDHLDLQVEKGEILGIVGGSGSGKSVLLRTIIGLQPPYAGEIKILGQPINDLLKRDGKRPWGVMFQNGALFSSLSLLENVETPLLEYSHLPASKIKEIARLKLMMVGLHEDDLQKLPSQISGGMRKRTSLARALALDPPILFLDEPTSGLDPISANLFDQLIVSLQKSLSLTVFMITHDLDSLKTVCDRIGVLVDKKIRVGVLKELLQDSHPWIRQYFHGDRARMLHQEQ